MLRPEMNAGVDAGSIQKVFGAVGWDDPDKRLKSFAFRICSCTFDYADSECAISSVRPWKDLVHFISMHGNSKNQNEKIILQSDESIPNLA